MLNMMWVLINTCIAKKFHPLTKASSVGLHHIQLDKQETRLKLIMVHLFYKRMMFFSMINGWLINGYVLAAIIMNVFQFWESHLLHLNPCGRRAVSHKVSDRQSADFSIVDDHLRKCRHLEW